MAMARSNTRCGNPRFAYSLAVAMTDAGLILR
jgi:hypothetical protein